MPTPMPMPTPTATSTRLLPRFILGRRGSVLIPLFLAAVYLASNLAIPQPPVAAQTTSFVFTAAGDYSFSADAAATLREIGAAAPVFNLALGDLSYSNTRPESEWCQFV